MTAVESTEASLTIRRTIDAPIERVFQALTDPAELARWYGGDLMDVEFHDVEAVPGGAFSFTMRDDDEVYDFDCEFLDVVENKRIVHSWYVGQVRYELVEIDGDTEVTLIHDGLPDRETTELHTEGWIDAIEKLETVLEKS